MNCRSVGHDTPTCSAACWPESRTAGHWASPGLVDDPERSQIQALERTQRVLLLKAGQAEKQSHDYRRHGTTTLFAALEVATGKVTDACYPRHRGVEFLKFLKLVAKAYPRRQLHIVVDNYSAHNHADVKAWLEKNPRIHLHFTPTHSSWMNRSNRSSPSSPDKPSAAPRSPPCAKSPTRSAGSSMPGTTAACRSYGPKSLTTSSPSPTGKPPQKRTTRWREGWLALDVRTEDPVIETRCVARVGAGRRSSAVRTAGPDGPVDHCLEDNLPELSSEGHREQ